MAVLAKRRKEVKCTVGASGIAEVYEEQKILSDDLILDIEEHVDQGREGEEDRLDKEKRQAAAGVELRKKTVNRGQGMRSGSEAVDADGESVARAASLSPTGTNNTRWIHYESID